MKPPFSVGAFREGLPPAAPAVDLLAWLARESSADSLDLLLFFGRVGRKLERMASAAERRLSRTQYIPMGSAALLLAATELATLPKQLPVIMSLGEGRSIDAWFKDLEIPLPSIKFISDIGLRPDTLVEPATAGLLARFLYAYRWEIFKVCREKRRELFHCYLRAGIEDGMRVGIVI
jgi:hypothetical protein